MKKILYISDLSEADPIFHSQVVPHINELKKYFSLTVWILGRSSVTEPGDESYYRYRSIPGDYFYYFASVNFLRQRKKIRSALPAGGFDLIYSRGIRGGILGSLIKNHFFSKRMTLLNDIRGDYIDQQKGNLIRVGALGISNRILYRNTDLLFLVSSFLKEKMCRDYHFDRRKAYVFPTFVPDNKFDFNEKNRQTIREQLKLTTHDIVILYSGNLAKWQNVETILDAFRQCTNDSLKMLILTKDTAIQGLLQKYNIPKDKVRLQNVRYEEIEKYYHAADFGILIRDNTDTNKSAAPTKFSEYINSGLSVIINLIDADYVRIFKEEKLAGFLLGEKNELKKCFDGITLSDLRRNVVKINCLGSLVARQRDILNTC